MGQQETIYTEEAYIYDTFSKKAARSVMIDISWIQSHYVPEKWTFLIKKYLLLAMSPFYWDEQSNSYRIRLFNRLLYLESPLDIGTIQSTLIDYDYLLPLIQKNGVVIDAGAHIGEFALVAELLLGAKKIYSFEPVQESFKRLQKNTVSKTFHAAICKHLKQEIHISGHTIMASGKCAYLKCRKEVSPCIALDAIPELESEHHIDLFKIDVEGMEYDVLETSKKILEKSRYIMMEASIDRPATKPALETIEFLRSILPNITLVHVGKAFGNALRTDSVDLLFKNATFHTTEKH